MRQAVVSGALVVLYMGACAQFVSTVGPPDAGGTDAAADARASVATADAGASDAEASTGPVLHCGPSLDCAGASSCCIDPIDGGRSCAATCTQARVPFECFGTIDCAARSPSPSVCCAYAHNDDAGHHIDRAICVPASACDTTTPLDQLCEINAADDCRAALYDKTVCAPDYVEDPAFLGITICTHP